jgi:CBS domain containing-hemolysin-like protein
MANMLAITLHCHEKLERDAATDRDDRVWQMPRIIKAKDGSYILRGEADLSEVAEETGMEISEADLENFDTVNGLIISLLDRIPSDGERENVSYGEYVISILEVKNKMIRKCRVAKVTKTTG